MVNIENNSTFGVLAIFLVIAGVYTVQQGFQAGYAAVVIGILALALSIAARLR